MNQKINVLLRQLTEIIHKADTENRNPLKEEDAVWSCMAEATSMIKLIQSECANHVTIPSFNNIQEDQAAKIIRAGGLGCLVVDHRTLKEGQTGNAGVAQKQLQPCGEHAH